MSSEVDSGPPKPREDLDACLVFEKALEHQWSRGLLGRSQSSAGMMQALPTACLDPSLLRVLRRSSFHGLLQTECLLFGMIFEFFFLSKI